MRKTPLLLLLLPTTLLAATDNNSAQISLTAWINYASINNGYMQIPIGGTPGTSSIDRPTFGELGINNTTNYNFEIAADWRNWGLYGIYNYNHPSRSAVLAQSLTTHGVTIPAATAINTDTKFDLYRIGLKYTFNLLNDRWQIYPLVEAAILNFNYEIQSAPATTSRRFNQATPRLGVGGKYFFTPTFYWDFELASSIGISNLSIQTGNTHLGYTIFANKSQNANLFTGITYTRINFQDSQTMPNHINYAAWPGAEIGLRVTIF